VSEVRDIVLPILQRMQADLGELKRDVAAIKQTLAGHTQKLEEMEIYIAYETGLSSQNKADLQTIKGKIKAVEDRLKRLEAGV